MAGSPGGVDAKEKPHISTLKLRVECDDIQGKAAGRNADTLGKENHKLSARLQLVSTTSIGYYKQ